MTKRRTGFTLIEMTMVLVGLGVVLMLMSAILVAALKTEHFAGQTSLRLVQQGELADQFRADVAKAVAAPAKWGEETAGPACLILRMADGKHVTYHWLSGRVRRSELGGPARSDHWLPVGSKSAGVELLRSGPDNHLITLRLTEKRDVKQPIDITAALGGDLR